MNPKKRTRLCDLNDDILWQLFKFIPAKGQDILHDTGNDWMKETFKLFWWTEAKHLTICEARLNDCEIRKWVKRCPEIRSLYYEVDGVVLQHSCESIKRLTKLKYLTIEMRPKFRPKSDRYIYAREFYYHICSATGRFSPSLVSLAELHFVFFNWTYFIEEFRKSSPFFDFKFENLEIGLSVYPDTKQYKLSLTRK